MRTENNTPDTGEQDNIIQLTDESGKDVDFEFLDLIEYEGADYVVLLPVEERDAGEAVILRIEHVEGTEEDTFVGIDDDAILDGVFAIFQEHYKDESAK